MKIQFEKANKKHIDTILSWLAEPHIQQFWDNSEEHKDDILNFIHGKPQNYFSGTTKYWIGSIIDEPYAFILSDTINKHQKNFLSDIHRKNISNTGNTLSLDFGIGNKKYLGKGLGAPTLLAFMNFYKNEIDTQTDTFFISPDTNNPKAIHVYSKAGFEKAGQFSPTTNYNNELMIKKI